MGRSFYKPNDQPEIENFTTGNHVFDNKNNPTYSKESIRSIKLLAVGTSPVSKYAFKVDEPVFEVYIDIILYLYFYSFS